jgi:hypothetical protein
VVLMVVQTWRERSDVYESSCEIDVVLATNWCLRAQAYALPHKLHVIIENTKGRSSATEPTHPYSCIHHVTKSDNSPLQDAPMAIPRIRKLTINPTSQYLASASAFCIALPACFRDSSRVTNPSCRFPPSSLGTPFSTRYVRPGRPECTDSLLLSCQYFLRPPGWMGPENGGVAVSPSSETSRSFRSFLADHSSRVGRGWE